MLPIPFDRGLVLFDEQGQRLHLLNPAAAAIWTLLDAGLPPAEAAVVLAGHAGRDETACAADIAALQERWATEATFDAARSAARRPASPRYGDGAPAFYEVSGIRLELTSESAEVATRAQAALGECAASPGGADLRLAVRFCGEDEMELIASGATWLTSHDPGEIVGGVFHLLLQRRWGENDWLTMIHAAALERDGKAVVLPGQSGSGKTTLAAYLSRRGFNLLGDDLAAVRSDGHVVPWPTQLSIKRGSWRALAAIVPELKHLPEQDVATRRLKLVAIGRAAWDQPPALVRALVLPRWTDGKEAVVTRLDPFDALAALVEDRLWLGWPMTAASVQGLLDWLKRVPAWRIAYPDLETAKAQVSEIWQEL